MISVQQGKKIIYTMLSFFSFIFSREWCKLQLQSRCENCEYYYMLYTVYIKSVLFSQCTQIKADLYTRFKVCLFVTYSVIQDIISSEM